MVTVAYLRREPSMKKLRKGWIEGTVKEFLRLTDADLKQIEKRCTPREKRQHRSDKKARP